MQFNGERIVFSTNGPRRITTKLLEENIGKNVCDLG